MTILVTRGCQQWDSNAVSEIYDVESWPMYEHDDRYRSAYGLRDYTLCDLIRRLRDDLR